MCAPPFEAFLASAGSFRRPRVPLASTVPSARQSAGMGLLPLETGVPPPDLVA